MQEPLHPIDPGKERYNGHNRKPVRTTMVRLGHRRRRRRWNRINGHRRGNFGTVGVGDAK